MNFFSMIIRFFQGGGAMMYPIAVVLVIGAAIAFERYVVLTATAIKNRSLWNEIAPLLAQGNFKGAVQITANPTRRSARSSATAWRASARRARATTSRRRWKKA